MTELNRTSCTYVPVGTSYSNSALNNSITRYFQKSRCEARSTPSFLPSSSIHPKDGLGKTMAKEEKGFVSRKRPSNPASIHPLTLLNCSKALVATSEQIPHTGSFTREDNEN